MEPILKNWRLWLPLAKRFGPQDENIIEGLGINDTEYQVAKLIHYFISLIPMLIIGYYHKTYHRYEPNMGLSVVAIALTVLMYFLVALPISLIWSRVNSR